MSLRTCGGGIKLPVMIFRIRGSTKDLRLIANLFFSNVSLEKINIGHASIVISQARSQTLAPEFHYMGHPFTQSPAITTLTLLFIKKEQQFSECFDIFLAIPPFLIPYVHIKK